MKYRTHICTLTIALAAAIASPAADQKPPKVVAPAAPKIGIKTPGIQLSFARVKAEAELPTPDKPEWIFITPGPTGAAFIPSKSSIDKYDLKTNKKADSGAAIDKPCGGMISAFGAFWAPSCGARGIARIDPKTLKITTTIAAGASAARGTIASSPDSIWVLTDSKTTLSRIDPDQNAVVGEIRFPPDCRSLMQAETSLWLACPAENKVLRINPKTNLLEESIKVSTEPQSIASGAGSVWAFCAKEGKIDRIDPKTNKVIKTIELNVPNADGEIAFGENFLWVTQSGFPLTRIDPANDTVMQQFSGDGGGAIAISTGAIWLSNLKAGTVWRIDPKLVVAIIPE